MKQFFLTFVVFLFATPGIGQTTGDAFYVYRNDGMINTFFRSEIDSISYSYYDTDSLRYDEIVTQVIHTQDSIYQIPLAVIDSVGFVTPKTEYQPDVISLEGAIRDYVIGSDSLTIYFRSNTPFNILPKTGDKLVTTEISDVFWGGFLGKVVDKEEKGDTIALHCDAIDLEEAYKCFYYSISGAPQSDFNKSRAKGLEWEGYYAPDPFVYSSTNFLKTFFQPINCPITFTPKFEISIAPTFGSKGSIIVHPLRGVVISMDIHQHTSFAEDLAVSGEIGLSKDISLIPGPIPMYPILPFVSIYGDLGVVFKANGKLTLEEHWGQSLDFDIHYEASYQPLLPMTISTSIPKLKISNVNFTTEHNGKFMFEGSGAFGGYGEIGIVPWLLKKVAKVGFRFEGGLKLEGNVMINNSDGEGALLSTSRYDKFRAGTLSLKSFCSVGMHAKLIGVGTGGVNFYDNEWPIAKYKIVPDFTNTKLTRDEDSPSTLIATTTAFGSTIFPCSLGFKMFDGAENDGFKGNCFHSYLGITGEPETYWGSFLLMPLTKNYSVYPTVELFGIEMLASPSAELDTSLKPVTLHVEDITETTAKVWGRIDGFDVWKDHISFGIKFTTPEEPNITYESIVKYVNITGFSSGQFYDDGEFYADIKYLKPNTIYNYCAFLTINGEDINGQVRQFKTKEESFCPDSHHPHLIDLGLPSGALWMCCNYGSNDPINPGDYLAWGETNEKNEYTKENYEWHHMDDDGTYVYDDATFDLAPSIEDVYELESECSKEEKTINDIKGRVYIGPNGNKIFLPYAGVMDSNLHYYGIEDHYWTSTLPSQNESRKNKRIVTRSNNDEDEGISHACDWYDFDWRYLGKNVRQVYH